ncbi:MAG: ASCH domain-containing protein [Acetatifactor sp.]|nr:ASCH domain-containing protein [Acetatifactor sp.]
MSIKPILFNTDMVRAILDGRKTVTRRLPSKRVEEKWWEYDEWASDACAGSARDGIPCNRTYEKEFYEQYPPYLPGDILYVRETWTELETVDGCPFYAYKADDGRSDAVSLHETFEKWHPSIHMPKEAARIWLKVTDVRVERLQEITEDQTEAEGFTFTPPCLRQVSEDSYCDLDGPCTSKIKYCDMSSGELFGKVLWDSTIPKQDLDTYGWDANPWVWVIEFERCEKPEEV